MIPSYTRDVFCSFVLEEEKRSKKKWWVLMNHIINIKGSTIAGGYYSRKGVGPLRGRDWFRAQRQPRRSRQQLDLRKRNREGGRKRREKERKLLPIKFKRPIVVCIVLYSTNTCCTTTKQVGTLGINIIHTSSWAPSCMQSRIPWPDYSNT